MRRAQQYKRAVRPVSPPTISRVTFYLLNWNNELQIQISVLFMHGCLNWRPEKPYLDPCRIHPGRATNMLSSIVYTNAYPHPSSHTHPINMWCFTLHLPADIGPLIRYYLFPSLSSNLHIVKELVFPWHLSLNKTPVSFSSGSDLGTFLSFSYYIRIVKDNLFWFHERFHFVSFLRPDSVYGRL